VDFRLWLEDYSQHVDKVISAASNRSFAFKDWFPTERIYLPLYRRNKTDKSVVDFLKDAGYEITDYSAGLAQKGKNIFKIGKLINAAWKKDLREIEAKKDEYSERKFRDEQRMANNYYKDLLNDFENSPARIGKGQAKYEVVISSNIHDIARMSTDQNWTSCMNLDDGENRKTVYCEIKNGGFVAYLLPAVLDPYAKELRSKESPEWTRIKDAKARILIRRFSSKSGKSIAIPEESIYGDPVPGFMETVKKWIESKQGKIKPGRYIKKGGPYSDTFGSDHFVTPAPTDYNILKMLEKTKVLSPVGLQMGERALAMFLSRPHKKWSPEVLEAIRNLIIERPDLIEYTNFEALADVISPEIFEKLSSHIQTRVANKFDKFNPVLKNLAQNQITNDLSQKIDLIIKDPAEYWRNVGSINDIFDRLQIYKPIPEPITQKIVSEVARLHKALGVSPHHVYENVANLFGSTGTDTPTVIGFYRMIMSAFDFMNGWGFYYGLSKLGINGREFLPFLKQKLEAAEHPIQKERLNYVIDSIESGKGSSSKYQLT